MKYTLFIIFFAVHFLGAQIVNKTDGNVPSDTLIIDKGGKDSLKIFKPTINDYQHYTQFSEKKIFDTVFTIDKSYQFTQYNNQEMTRKTDETISIETVKQPVGCANK